MNKPIFSIIILITVYQSLAPITARERVIEISSRTTLANTDIIIGETYAVNFYSSADSDEPISPPIKYVDEKFSWSIVPPNAHFFQLIHQDASSARIALYENSNTYVKLSKKTVDNKAAFHVVSEKKIQLERGRKGWVYLGKLEKDDVVNSDWFSIYIVDKKGKQLDQDQKYTFSKLLDDIKDMTFRTNFPLLLRDAQLNKLYKPLSDQVYTIRSGQLISISRLSYRPYDKTVWALVETKHNSSNPTVIDQPSE